MGKGDRRTAKGKRYNSSYGNARPKAVTKAAGSAAAPVAKKATKTTKKVVAKKATKAARASCYASLKTPPWRGFCLGDVERQRVAPSSTAVHTRSRLPPSTLRMSASDMPAACSPAIRFG